MKETGLMFKTHLVQAILAGQKTQTRRVVKWKDLQQGLNLGFSGLAVEKTKLGWVLRSDTRTSSEWRCSATQCPMGQPGDRIYVRETFPAPARPTEGVPDGFDKDAELLDAATSPGKGSKAKRRAALAATPAAPAAVASNEVRVAELESVLTHVQEEFKKFGNSFPDGFDWRVFRFVDDALAGVPAAAPDALTQAARDVLAERARQISTEGWTPEHDDEHSGHCQAPWSGG
jgi:hypothetical protein